MSKKIKCANADCHCMITIGCEVIQDGLIYCCRPCADHATEQSRLQAEPEAVAHGHE